MDAVPSAGVVCARLGWEAKIADTATMPAVIANAKQWPVGLVFDDMLGSCLADTRRHSVASPMHWSNGHLGEWPLIVVNFISSYSSQFISVNRVKGRPAV